MAQNQPLPGGQIALEDPTGWVRAGLIIIAE